jgi:hypothetical protein
VLGDDEAAIDNAADDPTAPTVSAEEIGGGSNSYALRDNVARKKFKDQGREDLER